MKKIMLSVVASVLMILGISAATAKSSNASCTSTGCTCTICTCGPDCPCAK